ncbi:hypothetical protein KCP75_02275 [Salmonella enterica subsp. enterica]|nr:hypothetical protein KCP75_02275 [Salmonella enterica subsp. enterica]
MRIVPTAKTRYSSLDSTSLRLRVVLQPFRRAKSTNPRAARIDHHRLPLLFPSGNGSIHHRHPRVFPSVHADPTPQRCGENLGLSSRAMGGARSCSGAPTTPFFVLWQFIKEVQQFGDDAGKSGYRWRESVRISAARICAYE